ncbi:hypothetical protein FRB94_005479 [Tulasnella sp. JGI-2019a]|nr:hypothetical protein FRB93_006122 [Tulasnella sp. JGI-2019a]KAG9000377.1 hypothetical protein FRB94_005479 [Tulasnella sp. JGI-2019a]KAG9029430.1 hypothetical protein FRB95_005323 [Tulasnella sp. JGI-2019a]
MDPWNEGTHLGPPSKQLNIPRFIEQAKQASLLDRGTATGDAITVRWFSISEPERVAIEGDCNLDDLAAQSVEHWSDPASRASLGIWQDETMLKTVESNALALDKDCKDWMKKVLAQVEKRRASEDEDFKEQVGIRQQLDGVGLDSWASDVDAVHYVVRPTVDSVNTLVEIREACYATPHAVDGTTDVLVTMSVFRYTQSRASPIHRLGARYVFLASHTLGDLVDLLACPSNDIPSEVVDEQGNVTDYKTDVKMDSGACIIGFEGVNDPGALEGASNVTGDPEPSLTRGLVFGDGTSDDDYASHYLTYIKMKTADGSEQMTVNPAQHRLMRATTCMADTPLHSLVLRLHFPYLLIHQGNCQHYFCIDQIRLRQTLDPPSSHFPLTIFAGAKSRANCRICAKWPASLSIVGDSRLGETPCLVCSRCWGRLGKSPDDEAVLIVPLTAGEMA